LAAFAREKTAHEVSVFPSMIYCLHAYLNIFYLPKCDRKKKLQL